MTNLAPLGPGAYPGPAGRFLLEVQIMTTERAAKIAAEFSTAEGYRVAAQTHGILVSEGRGKTSFFTDEGNFFRYTETLVARVHPIPRTA